MNTCSGSSRLAFIALSLYCAIGGAGPAQAFTESAEAAKAAAWLKAAAPIDTHFSVLGLPNLGAGLGNAADSTISAQGPAAFYQSTSAVQGASNAITSQLSQAGPLLRAGGITAFRDVQNLPWGMIEPAQGQYNFSLMDVLIQNYQTYGIDYVGVAMPFASWDLASKPAAAANCQHFFTEDYKYLAAAGKMDRYVNLTAFTTMLQTAAERYDGDGVSDMTGLTRPIKYWQIQNEPEGNNCGQFRGDVAAFVELMRLSHAAVKAACPSCQVINAGAGLVERQYAGGDFWWEYASLGGKPYIDIVAVHYNEGKDPGATDPTAFETRLANIKDALGSDKPIWVTEFGVIVNAPAGGTFTSLTETQAAAWYTRFYAAGLNGGVTRFFSDAISFYTTGAGPTVLLPYYTNKLMQAKLGGFSASSRLAAGQYRFTVRGAPVYVLWSGVPAELSGTVISYDIYGNETTGDASALHPTQDAPLIVTLPASMQALFVNASTSPNKTSELRIINPGGSAGTLAATIYDESGTRRGTAAAPLGSIGAYQTLSFTSAQLENLTGFTPASGTSKYSVYLTSSLDNLELINYTRDKATGLLTLSQSLAHDRSSRATAASATRTAWFLSASTSASKTNVLRILNTSNAAGNLTASAHDENGNTLGIANASLGSIAARQMKSYTSAELESALGFTPASPTAKYRVTFSANVASMELINFTKDIASGNLALVQAQLEERAASAASNSTRNVLLVYPSINSTRTTVLRIVNPNNVNATVAATAYNEAGSAVGSGALGVVNPNGILALTSSDIETALAYSPGTPGAKYRLVLSANVPSFEVINNARMSASGNLYLAQAQTDSRASGLATSTTRSALVIHPSSGSTSTTQLVLVNTSAQSSTLTANGYDDSGMQVVANKSLGTLGPYQMLTLTSAQLQNLTGYTPASAMKWRLTIAASLPGFELINYAVDTGSGVVSIAQPQTE